MKPSELSNPAKPRYVRTWWPDMSRYVEHREGDPAVKIGDFSGMAQDPNNPNKSIPHHWKGCVISDKRTPEQKEIDVWAAKEFFEEVRRKEQAEKNENLRVEFWHDLFHTKAETENAPTLSYAIEGFLPERGVTMLGGRSGDGKTLIALNMARCLIEGAPLFGHFAITKPSTRVVYLVPESSLSSFVHRLRLFHLVEQVGLRFFYRTLDAREPDTDLTDRAILKACEGADVFLDTAVRFMDGEENSASDNRQFARNLFALLRAGARTVTGLHHSPKQFERATYMSLENLLRGSGDIGAMLAMAWGVSQVDYASTRIYVQNVKDRDPKPEGTCQPFMITGRPHIDQGGHFAMTTKPGMTMGFEQEKKSRQQDTQFKEMADKDVKLSEIRQLQQDNPGITQRQLATATGISQKTISRWLTEQAVAKRAAELPK